MTPDYSDYRVLLGGILRNEDGASLELIRRLRKLRPYVRDLLRNDPDAIQECIHETYIGLVKAIRAKSIRKPESWWAFVVGMAKTKAVEMLRDRPRVVSIRSFGDRQMRSQFAEPVSRSPDPEQRLLIREQERLRSARVQLAVEIASSEPLLAAIYVQHKSNAQIRAEFHICGLGALRSRKMRALARVHEWIKKQDQAEDDNA